MAPERSDDLAVVSSGPVASSRACTTKPAAHRLPAETKQGRSLVDLPDACLRIVARAAAASVFVVEYADGGARGIRHLSAQDDGDDEDPHAWLRLLRGLIDWRVAAHRLPDPAAGPHGECVVVGQCGRLRLQRRIPAHPDDRQELGRLLFGAGEDCDGFVFSDRDQLSCAPPPFESPKSARDAFCDARDALAGFARGEVPLQCAFAGHAAVFRVRRALGGSPLARACRLARAAAGGRPRPAPLWLAPPPAPRPEDRLWASVQTLICAAARETGDADWSARALRDLFEYGLRDVASLARRGPGWERRLFAGRPAALRDAVERRLDEALGACATGGQVDLFDRVDPLHADAEDADAPARRRGLPVFRTSLDRSRRAALRVVRRAAGAVLVADVGVADGERSMAALLEAARPDRYRGLARLALPPGGGAAFPDLVYVRIRGDAAGVEARAALRHGLRVLRWRGADEVVVVVAGVAAAEPAVALLRSLLFAPSSDLRDLARAVLVVTT
jgi:hypothetical protein